MNGFLSFALTSLIIELTPGPNMAYLAILSVSEGRRAGFSAVAGIALGLLIVGIIAGLGVATVISESPILYQSLRWCGVFYLLWLAWDGWHSIPETLPEKPGSAFYNAKFFMRGLATNLLNPKAAIFYITILPNFFSASGNTTLQTFILTFIYVGVATTAHALLVLLAGSAQPFLEDPRLSLIVRRVLSLLLGLVALWFAASTGKAFLLTTNGTIFP